MKNVLRIILQILPIVVMILLIPLVLNDYILAGIYLLVIAASLLLKYEKNDALFLVFGVVGLFFSEWLFISTGVETSQKSVDFWDTKSIAFSCL